MNGPWHYTEAERLLAGHPISAEERTDGIEGDNWWPPSEMELQAAHVHALLAVAASNTVRRGFNEDWARAFASDVPSVTEPAALPSPS